MTPIVTLHPTLPAGVTGVSSGISDGTGGHLSTANTCHSISNYLSISLSLEIRN